MVSPAIVEDLVVSQDDLPVIEVHPNGRYRIVWKEPELVVQSLSSRGWRKRLTFNKFSFVPARSAMNFMASEMIHFYRNPRTGCMEWG